MNLRRCEGGFKVLKCQVCNFITFAKVCMPIFVQKIKHYEKDTQIITKGHKPKERCMDLEGSVKFAV